MGGVRVCACVCTNKLLRVRNKFVHNRYLSKAVVVVVVVVVVITCPQSYVFEVYIKYVFCAGDSTTKWT